MMHKQHVLPTYHRVALLAEYMRSISRQLKNLCDLSEPDVTV
jgi:hypothetical protein